MLSLNHIIRRVVERLSRGARVLLISVLVIPVCILCGCERSGSGTIGPGVSVPDIEYQTLDGETRSLKEFRGKVVVLNFLASWCAPCLSEMPALNALHEQIEEVGGTVLAIGVDDDPGQLREFASRAQVKFPLLLDREGRSHRFFNISGFPETVILDRRGRVIMTPDIAGQGASGEPVVKFVGPRDWDDSYFTDLVRKIASK